MLHLLKTQLPKEVEIVQVKETFYKYRITFTYRGIGATSELSKTCVPGDAETVVTKCIATALSTICINLGDIDEAKYWLQIANFGRIDC